MDIMEDEELEHENAVISSGKSDLDENIYSDSEEEITNDIHEEINENELILILNESTYLPGHLMYIILTKIVVVFKLKILRMNLHL